MTDFLTVALDYMALIGAFVGFGFVAIIGFVLTGNGDEKDRLNRRLARVSGTPIEEIQPKSIRSQKTTSNRLEKTISKLIPDADKVQTKIHQAGFGITPGRLGLTVIALFSMALITLLHLTDRSIAMTLISAFTFSIGLPYMVIKTRSEKRLQAFVALLPDALDLICRGLRAGLPVMESIATVGEELPDPIGHEFRDLRSRVQMGSTLEDGLWEMARRIPSDELRFLITAISIQRETGGNLAETLGNLSDLLRKRKQFKLKVKAMSSEARASAWIIGSLPFAMFGILSILNPGYLSVLISDPRGIAMTVFGLSLIAIGAFIMMKLVKFEA